MTWNLPFNFKQTHQTSYVRPCFLLLSKACLKKNIPHIVIITLLCKSKNVINLIVLVNLHLLPSQICSHCLLNFFLVTFLVWNVNFSWVNSSCCDGASWCCCKSSFYSSFYELEMKSGLICSLVPTCLIL